MFQNSLLLGLSIPREQAVLFGRERWQKVLSFSCARKGRKDEVRFKQKMNQVGVSTYWEVSQSPLCLYLKSEVKESWNHIFDIDNMERTNLGATVWQIR